MVVEPDLDAYQPNILYGGTSARWDFHFSYSTVPGCTLTVWGTKNCQKIEPPVVSNKYANACSIYSGTVPDTANDLLMYAAWDYWCHNKDWIKFASPVYQQDRWWLNPLPSWFRVNVDWQGLALPTIGDPTGDIQEVYYVVNLDEWLSNPQPMQEQYNVINGETPDLPGYLIGTTPIVFDSLAGPGENPFSTTPLTDTLYLDGDVTGIPVISCCNTDGRRGDVDGSGSINVADVTYLVAYLKGLGPAPPACP
jgi:hypothetical protein